MALGAIAIGCDWSVVVVVEPSAGRTNADVTTDLTGATVTATIRDASNNIVATPTASVSSAANRTLSITLSAAATAALLPTARCFLEIRVLTSGGKTQPVAVKDLIDVRQFVSGEHIPGVV